MIALADPAVLAKEGSGFSEGGPSAVDDIEDTI
jgi:hypothetical protein